MRKLYTLLFLLLLYSSTQAQVLQTTNLNLNAGGVIHDVAYDSYYDAYIVVGDFTQIGTELRNNLAFIDANTLDVMSFAPVSSIDGPIRSVEIVNFVPHSGAPGAGFRNYIYLGGNFTTINTQTKTAIARLFSTHYYSQPPAGGLANYSVQLGWDAQFFWTSAYGSEFGIHDFHLTGDTLIAVGEFTNVGASYLSGDFHRKVISIDADHQSFLVKNLNFLNGIVPFGTSGTEPIQGIEQLDDRLFLYGEDQNLELINEYQLDGTFVQQIEYCNPNNHTVLDFEAHPTSIDTMFFAYEGLNYGAGAYYIGSYLKDGTVWNCPGVSTTNFMLDFPNMGQVTYVETYKDFVFTAGSNTNAMFVSKRNGTANVPVLNSFSLNNNWFLNYPNISAAPSIEVNRNLLFFSTDALTSVDGQTRTGLAVFCLEPTAAESFTQSDPTACEGDSSIYTIPQAQCADGYRWTYSGTGALYRITGSGNAWAALSSIDLIGSNTNSIEILYPLGATSGTLSVEPFTIFSAVDNHYSQGQSVAITVNQKPDIILPSTYALNCYSDSTLLVAQTNNPNPQFLWTFNSFSDSLANDSLLITINDVPLFDSMYYYMQITDALTGCFDIDSTFFTQDLVADSIDLNLVSTNPNEWNCLTDSMIVSSGQTGFTITWEDQANLGTFHLDPYTIYTAPTSNYYIHGTQISNGCSTQKEYGGIVVNTDAADPVLVGHPNFLTDFPDDSLSCLTPSLTLQCDVDPVYSGVASAQWSYNGTSLGSDILNLTTADSAGMDGLNVKYYWIVTTHSTSQCADSTQITVRFDYEKPLITQLADQSINCSQSEILLTHPLSPSGNVIEGWLDPTGTQTTVDTIVATTTGDYYYQATSNFNGCSNADTVSVTQSLDLLLNMPSDTTICPDELITITPSVIGNSETPSFVWSTGSTGMSETAIGGIDSLLTVTVSTPSGCSGTDSTNISINSPVDMTVTPYIACSDGSLEITDITGGAGNYQYSIDGTTWQDSTNFPSLAFGTYSIFVQDDLGCIYDTTQTLDGTASTVEMNFVVSTYNEEGDTIALVNITDFTGLDSVSWTLPPNANVTFEDDSIVILSMDVAGWYDIELTGYIGSDCEYTFTKPVYFGDHAPIFNDSIVFNGIDSLVIYPNPLNISQSNNMITVYVEFGKSQNYTILVTNNLGQPIPSMSVSGVGTIANHQLLFPTGTAAGAYRVHVIADYDAKQEMITLY